MSPTEPEDNVDAQIDAVLAGGADAAWRSLWDAVDTLAREDTFATWEGGDVIATTGGEGEAKPVYLRAFRLGELGRPASIQGGPGALTSGLMQAALARLRSWFDAERVSRTEQT